MAGLLSAVLIAGMVSGAAPMNAYAEENPETENVAGGDPFDETESETTDITGELPEGAAGETEKDPAEEPSEETTTDPVEKPTEEDAALGDEDAKENDALPEDEIALVEEENALMEENPEKNVVLFAEHIHGDGITFEPWTEADSLPEAEGNYYLTQNVTITERWLVREGTIRLCLNGKTITMGNHTFGECIVIISSEGGELDLYDCVGSGKMTGADNSCVSNAGIFRMYGGEISGNSNDKSLFPDISGGGVSNQGTFDMYGGRITNNHNSYGGGGVYNKSGATFCMYGGEITNNAGGGVRNNGTFYLYDGKIENNTSVRYGGGGVYNQNSFYMYGGKITNNTSTNNAGGGVSNSSLSGAFYMYGGEISGNASILGGGGVMVYSPIYVYNGKISGNRVINSGAGSGGVWFGAIYSDTGTSAYGRLTVGDSAIISGNKDVSGTESNVGVSNVNTIVIDGEKSLSGNAVIGITAYDSFRPTEGNPRRVTDANAADYSAYFHSDDPKYAMRNGTDNAILIVLASDHTHQWADTWDCNATHHWHICSAAGCTIMDNAAKDGYAAHTEDSGTVTKEPTGTEAGIRTYRCRVCGYVVRTETIPATGTGGDKPDDGNDDKPNNGGGEEHPDDNNKPSDNPPENNNDSGNNNVSDNHTIANSDSESVDVPENVNETDTANSGEPVLDTDTETPVMIQEQPKDPEPKTADATSVELYATLAMISGLTYVILYFADRNGGMTEETKKELVSKLIRWAKRGKTLRRLLALSAIFVLLVYYHSIGKQGSIEWKEAC